MTVDGVTSPLHNTYPRIPARTQAGSNQSSASNSSALFCRHEMLLSMVPEQQREADAGKGTPAQAPSDDRYASLPGPLPVFGTVHPCA